MGWEARASSAPQNHFLCRKDNTLDPLLEQASSFLPFMSRLSGIRIGCHCGLRGFTNPELPHLYNREITAVVPFLALDYDNGIAFVTVVVIIPAFHFVRILVLRTIEGR
jgi:hypothetical protein